MQYIGLNFPLRLIILAIAIASSNSVSAQTLAGSVTSAAEPTGRLIIRYRQENQQAGLGALQGNEKRTDSLDRRDFRHRQGLKLTRRLSTADELLQITDATGTNKHLLKQRAADLTAESAIESASIEYKRYPLIQPNDPLFLDSTNSGPGNQSYLYEGAYSLRAPGAWDITTGSQNSVIAIIDTGMLPNHPELANRSISGQGYDFVSADGPDNFISANDGDGRDPDPTDPGDYCGIGLSSWHGTGVASVAAGNSNDAQGISGIDWNARILHARALGRCGGTDADIIDAIRWSAGLTVSGLPINQTPATVVNLSIGGPTECTPAWQQVINELNALNIPFVIAAGNERDNALRSSPANCADVITVGSSTANGNIANDFSNYGLKVTVAAPGDNIVMATNSGLQEASDDGDTYKLETGSSFSAAIVSGAISLMQSVNNQLTPEQIRNILQNSATPFANNGECTVYYCGSGILNLSRVVTMVRDGNTQGTNKEKLYIDSQTSPLPLLQTTTGSLFGYRDIRYYRINTQQAGVLTITSESNTNLYGYLLNDQLSVVALDDNSGTALNFRVASYVPAGDYYLAIERSTHNRNDGEAAFNITAIVNLDSPQPFSFSPLSNAKINSAASSETITVQGLQDEAIVSVSGGYYSLNGQPFTDLQGTVVNGDTLLVTLQTAGSTQSETSLNLNVGAYSTGFSVTTGTNAVPSNNYEPAGSSNRGFGCTLIDNTSSRTTQQPDPTLPALLLLTSLSLLRSRKQKPATG